MGPFTAAQVTEMMADGRLSPKDMAWTEGLHEWTQLSALVPAPVKTKEPKDSPAHEPEPTPEPETMAAAPKPAKAARGGGKALLWAGVGLGTTAAAIVAAVYLLKEREEKPAAPDQKTGPIAKGNPAPPVQTPQSPTSNKSAPSVLPPAPPANPLTPVNPPVPTPIAGSNNPVSPPVLAPQAPPAVVAALNVASDQASFSPQNLNVFFLNHWPDPSGRLYQAAEAATALVLAGKTQEAQEVIRRAWADVRDLPKEMLGEFGRKIDFAGAALLTRQGKLAEEIIGGLERDEWSQYQDSFHRPHALVELARQGKVAEARAGLRNYLGEMGLGNSMVNELRALTREGQQASARQLVAVVMERLAEAKGLPDNAAVPIFHDEIAMAVLVQELGEPARAQQAIQKIEALAKTYKNAGQLRMDDAAALAGLLHKAGHADGFQDMVDYVQTQLKKEALDEEENYDRVYALLDLAPLYAARKKPAQAVKALGQALALSHSIPQEEPWVKWRVAVQLARMDDRARSRQLARDALAHLEALKQNASWKAEGHHAMEPHELSNLREKYGAHHSPEKLRAMYIQSELGFSVQDSIERLSGMAAEFAGWLTHDDYNLDYHYRNAFNPAEQELAKALVDVVNGRIEPEALQSPPAVPPLPEWARRIPDHPSMVVAANFGQFLDILKQLPSPLRKRLQLGDSILTILDVLMQAGTPKFAAQPSVLWMKSVPHTDAQTMEWTVGLRIPVKGVEAELRKLATNQKLDLPFEKESVGPFKLLDLHNLLQLTGAGLKLGDEELLEIKQCAAGYIGIADDQVVLLGLVNWKHDPDYADPVPAPLVNGPARARGLFRQVFVQAPPVAITPVRWAKLSHSTTLYGVYFDSTLLSAFTPDLSAGAKKAYKELSASAAFSAVIRLDPNALNFEATMFHDKLTGEGQSTLPKELLAALPSNTVNAAALALDMSAVREFVMNDVVKWIMKFKSLEGKVVPGDLQAQFDEQAREYLGLPLTEFTSLVPHAVVLGLSRPGGAMADLGRRPPPITLGAQMSDAAAAVRTRGQLEEQLGANRLQSLGLKFTQRGNLLFLGTRDLPPSGPTASKPPPIASYLKDRAATIVIDGPTITGLLGDVGNPDLGPDKVIANRVLSAVGKLTADIRLGKGQQDFRVGVTLRPRMTWEELFLQVNRAFAE